jgi:hypothetical protein
MHCSIIPQEIETEIENLGHTATNIWNIKQPQPLSVFSVELKPDPNNKDIFNVVQNEVPTAQTQKGYCSIANC